MSQKALGIFGCICGIAMTLQLAAWLFMSNFLLFVLRWVFANLVSRLIAPGSLPVEKPEAPSTQLAFWFYNITNLDEFKTGSIPSVATIGPYVYDDYTYFHDVVYSEDAPEVAFKIHSRFVFNAEASSGSEADQLSAPNPSFVNLSAHHGFSQAAALTAVCATDQACKQAVLDAGTTVATRTVDQWLWDFNDPIKAAVTGNGAHGNIMGCSGDRDVEEMVSYCNATFGLNTVYSGADHPGKWFSPKADDELPSLVALAPNAQPGPDGWMFPAEESWSFLDLDVGVLHMDVLEDAALGVLPVKRFVVSSTVLTDEGGLFNKTSAGPYMGRWASSCGWEDGKYSEQYSTFVSGQVTGYPDCDFTSDAYHLDVDIITGIPWQKSRSTETAVIVTAESDGVYVNKPAGVMEGSGLYIAADRKYSLLPFHRKGELPAVAVEGLMAFFYDALFLLYDTLATLSLVWTVLIITFVVICVIGSLLVVKGKGK